MSDTLATSKATAVMPMQALDAIDHINTHITAAPNSFIIGLTVFVLACFVGYFVVWRVTPALHSPLMAVTNAISSVIIVGAILAAGSVELNMAKIFGFIAVVLAAINIFGGFIVTGRMLNMFAAKKK